MGWEQIRDLHAEFVAEQGSGRGGRHPRPARGPAPLEEAALAASRATKVAKVYLNPAQDNVSASVELLVAEPADMHAHFLRCLGILGTATGKFLEEMSARLAAAQADRPA